MKNHHNPDAIQQFNIPVVIRFSAIAAVTTIILITLHFWFNQKGNTRATGDLGFIIAAISGMAGTISAIYSYQSMRHSAQLQEKHHKIDKSLELITLWDDEQLSTARITVSNILQNVNGNILDRSDYLRNHLRAQSVPRQDVTILLNLLEKVAICWEADLLDESLIKEFYQPIVEQCWTLFSGYVAECRLTRNNANLYAALERLHDRWQRHLVSSI
jgi:Domain of unknown function (DUF4760)